MRIKMEMLAGPPEEYDRVFFANFIRTLNLSLRRIDYVPVYDPTSGQSSIPDPSDLDAYLKSDGSVLISNLYNPEEDLGIVPKWWIDELISEVYVALGVAVGNHNHQEADITNLDKYTQAEVDALLANQSVIGKQTEWIDVDRMTLSVAGADFSDVVIGGRTWRGLNLDPDTKEEFFFPWRIPANINTAGATSITYVWSHGAGATTFDVQFGHDVIILGDGADMTGASETASAAVDSGGTADTLYISPAITLDTGGSLVGGSVAMLNMNRDAGDVLDTLDIDARLHLIGITYEIDSGNEN